MFENNGVVLLPRPRSSSPNQLVTELQYKAVRVYDKIYSGDAKNRTCKACGGNFVSYKKTPVCNDLKCYLKYYGG